jgi:DNA-binding HxlR family transcriptional regulator
MPLRSDWSARPCPIARSLDVVGDPWVLLVLRDALLGARRFEQFREGLEVADNVLSRRLQAMVKAGLLRKASYRGEQRTHQEYLLTEAGAELLPVLNALALWGEKYTTPPRPDAHIEIVHTACGGSSNSADVCSGCGAAMAAEDTAWRRNWQAPALTRLQPAGNG